MDISTLKQQLAELNLPEPVVAKMNEVLDRAEQVGGISEDDKRELIELTDLAMEMGELEAETSGDMALALTGFADQLTRISQVASKQESMLEDSADEAVRKLEDELREIESTSGPESGSSQDMSQTTESAGSDQPQTQLTEQPTEETMAAPADQPMAGA